MFCWSLLIKKIKWNVSIVKSVIIIKKVVVASNQTNSKHCVRNWNRVPIIIIMIHVHV